MNTHQQPEKFEIPAKYVAALWRHKSWVSVSIVLFAAISAFVAVSIPPTYRSSGVVLVETQQIPDELIQSTITSAAAERIQIIRQRVMTRDRMLTVMDKYPELLASLRGDLLSERVQQLREDVSIELISSNPRSRQDTTIAFSVAFDSRDPEIAQAVANDLVTMFLDENVKTRTERATETTGFLESEATKVRERLAETEAAIARFKEVNKDALPEHLDLYLSMLERARSESIEIRRQIEVETNQVVLLENNLANQRPIAQDNPELARLEAEYARLTSLYLPSHPDVKSVQQQLDQARSIRKTTSQNPALQLTRSNIAASENNILLLTSELEKSRQAIEALEQRVVQIPQVEQGLIALNRDYQAVKAQYDQLVEGTMRAQMAESLEQGRKAERFALLEAPVVPDQPHSPDRKMVLGAGLAASAGLPLGLALLLGFFDNSVRGRASVERLVGIAPLVAVGLIESSEPEARRLWRWMLALLIICVFLVGAALFIHTQVRPLDVAFYQLLFKFDLQGLIP